MSDQPTEAPEQETAETEAPPATEQQPKPTETVDFWKQKAREQEKRAKDNADAARRLSEYEDAQKSEAQKQAEALERSTREAQEARSEAARYRIAAQHGIGPDHFDLLGSGDEDTITKRAEAIKPLLAAAAERDALKAEVESLRAGKPSPGASRPTAALRPGATPQDVAPEDDNSYPAHWLGQQAHP